MKRSFLFLMIAILGMMYYTTGKPSEIADRVLVNAVGVDTCEGGYKLTMQVFMPEGSGGDTPLDPSKPNVRLVKGVGDTVEAAAKECCKQLDGELFLGQNRIIFFGKGIDLSRRDELFGFFLSSSEAFLNVDCAAAEPSAEELLSMPVDSGSVASERYVKMIRSGESTASACGCSFTELISAMDEPSQTVMLPMFALKNDGKKDTDSLKNESAVLLSYCALFKGGKFCKSISCENAALISAVSGKGRYILSGTGRLMRVRSREVKAQENGGMLEVTVILRVSPAQTRLFHNTYESGRKEKEEKLLTESGANEICRQLSDEGFSEITGYELWLKRYAPRLFAKLSESERCRHVLITVRIV